MEQPLYTERDGDPRNNLYPIGRLGDHNHSVEVLFVHESDFHSAAEKWNRRRKRINKERIFVKFGFNKVTDILKLLNGEKDYSRES